jgi:hypothetical protein
VVQIQGAIKRRGKRGEIEDRTLTLGRGEEVKEGRRGKKVLIVSEANK